MTKKLSIYSRPISPHLVIYSVQLSSLFSIWHRITGIVLFSALALSGLAVKTSLIQQEFCSTDVVFYTNIVYWPWFGSFLFSTFLLVFFYHFLNGCRHIIWDTGRLLSVKNLDISSFVLTSFVTAVLVLSLL